MIGQCCKKRILIFADYYLPGYKAGGPIQSISNIVELLGDKYEFNVVTGDRDWSECEDYKNININCWNDVGKAKVYYLSQECQNWAKISELLQSRNYNLIYLNSFCSFEFSIIPIMINRLKLKWKVPVLLAQRGELSKPAFRNKAIRKNIYRYFMKYTGIARKCYWHVSSKDEKQELIEMLNVCESKIYIAPNLPGNDFVENISSTKNVGQIKIAFLSRICPGKNLDVALRILARLKGNVHFHIYGILGDQEYWQKCKQIIKELPSNIVVCYQGELQRHSVIRTIAEHDVFFFPTATENYGHVIHEALRAGLPVIISDRTPWHDVEKNGAGWECKLECEEEFVDKLQMCIGMSAEELKTCKMDALKYGRAVSQNEEVVQSNHIMFERVLNGSI